MIDTRTAPYAALVLRLALGVMFLAHGLVKVFVFTPAGTVSYFVSIGFMGWLAYPVIAAELLGGLMLILGVYPRWVAAALSAELLVITSVHLGNGWQFNTPKGGWEYPLFLAAAALALALIGDGAHSLRPSPSLSPSPR